MTNAGDGLTGYWQDLADLKAENARLRAEVDFANERMHKAQNELDALRAAPADPAASPWADHLAKMHKERDDALAELRALRAAPSDAEIEAWRKSATDTPAEFMGSTGSVPFDDVFEVHQETIDEAVALMRRASAAPAQSALRDAAEKAVEWLDYCERRDVAVEHIANAHRDCAGRLRLALTPPDLAAAPEAKESGVVVPDGVRRWAKAQAEEEGDWPSDDPVSVGRWILSLPTPQPAAALAKAPQPPECPHEWGEPYAASTAGYVLRQCRRCDAHYSELVLPSRRETVEEEINRLYGHTEGGR